MKGGNEARFLRIVGSHLFRYPLMQPRDLYKLMFQASMGSAHGIEDRYKATDSLYREIQNLPSGPPEPMVDIISHEGDLARINLRPYMAAGGDPDGLLEAFVRTSADYGKSLQRMEQYRSWVVGMDQEELLPPPLKGIAGYFREMMTSGYPAVHHSEIYRKAYSPAYRVILSDLVSLLSIFPGEVPRTSHR